MAESRDVTDRKNFILNIPTSIMILRYQQYFVIINSCVKFGDYGLY